MIKQRARCIQTTLVISPHGSHFPGAVGAYVRLKAPIAFEHLRSVPHILVNGLPGTMPCPVCTVLPHIQPPRLGQHPSAQLNRQIYPVAFAGLRVSHIGPGGAAHRLRFKRQHVINPQSRRERYLDRQRIAWHHCRQYKRYQIVTYPLTAHLYTPRLQSRFCKLMIPQQPKVVKRGRFSTINNHTLLKDGVSGLAGMGGPALRAAASIPQSVPRSGVYAGDHPRPNKSAVPPL